MKSDGLYQDVILENYSDPEYWGELSGADVVEEGRNPSCGDEVEVMVCGDRKKIEDMRFKGSGCAISMAVTNMLIDRILTKKMSPEQILKLELKQFLEEVGIGELTVARLKCARLGFEAIVSAVRKL